MSKRYPCPVHGWWCPPHPPKDDCQPCWVHYGKWRAQRDAAAKLKPRGTAKGGGRSSKQKGRSACLQVQAALLAAAPWLTPDDIYVKATSQLGVDLHLSPRAQAWFGYSIEAKKVELLNIWKALKQADDNASPDAPPIVFFTRAHADLYVALRASDFLKLVPCPKTDVPMPSTS